MSSAQIRISKTKELQQVLSALHEQFKLLSEAEIIKLALSNFYYQQQEEHIRQWEASLPSMQLTDDQQDEITKALQEKEPARPMSVKEIMDDITAC